MRLFVGLRPSESFRTALAVLQDRLRAAGVTGRYLDPRNLHMTLAFIGEWPENITLVLPQVERPFSIRLAHPGIFPEAKVLWAGIEESEELCTLAEQVRSTLSGHDIPFDPKTFNPHITLLRKPSLPDGTALSGIMVPNAEMIVNEVCLYRSDHLDTGMEYTVIGSSKEMGS